jgi:hypothetical protein
VQKTPRRFCALGVSGFKTGQPRGVHRGDGGTANGQLKATGGLGRGRLGCPKASLSEAPRNRVEIVHHHRLHHGVPVWAIAVLALVVTAWISPLGQVIAIVMISMGLVMHPEIAIAIGIFMALTSKLGTSSGAGCFFAMLNVTSFFGYGRNRSTANALSCSAPGEAPSPSPSITRRWTRPLARPSSQAEPRFMKRLLLFMALLSASSPVAAQSASHQPLGAGGATNNSPLTDTGVICQEEMTATFCNVNTNPNNAGYGTNGGAAATSGITTSSPAIPTCGGFPPANELCN